MASRGSSTKLLDLPFEIRFQILKYLLHSPTPLSRITKVVKYATRVAGRPRHERDISYWRFESGGCLNLHPAILVSCRQIHAEGHPILYRNTLLISIALYRSFSPVDVLGHWRFDDFLPTKLPDPRAALLLPRIEWFSNLRFDVYIDFTGTRNVPFSDLWEICAQVAQTCTSPLDSVTLHIEDGSYKARWSSDKHGKLWRPILDGMAVLNCKKLTISGDVPRLCRIEFWEMMRGWQLVSGEQHEKVRWDEIQA